MTRPTNPLAIVVISLMLVAVSDRCFAGNLSGAIVVDTLKKADSPFIVTGNISVPSWHTLTVERGVVLKFNLGLSFTIDGVLQAVGTHGDSIRFTSNEASPNLGDWNGVLFSSTGGGTLKYVAVEFAGSGVLVAGSAPSIQNSTFRMNSNGIDCMNSATPLLENNLFHDNSNTAIRCTDSSPSVRKNVFRNNIAVSSAILCQASSPLIAENVFRQNGSAAIDCLSGAAPQVWQNTIVQNDFGITIGDSSSPSIANNIIANNSNFGVAINDVAAVPVINYNDVWSNGAGEYFGTAPEVGALSTTNSNGDSSDVFMNISLDPKFVDLARGNVQLQVTSPCVDAGDPSNPAGVLKWGSAPDQGAFEFDGTLPVELVSFVFDAGLLKWTTASETDNFGFEVERSGAAEGDFIKVGFVPGGGTTTSPRHYEFRDTVSVGTFYYRLKQIDTDGTFAYSGVVRAVYSVTSFSLAQNYPNPFNPSTTISFQLPEDFSGADAEPVVLTIFNARGQRVAELLNERKGPGIYQLRWNGVDNLGRPVASGVYFYQLRMGQLRLTRRMILTR